MANRCKGRASLYPMGQKVMAPESTWKEMTYAMDPFSFWSLCPAIVSGSVGTVKAEQARHFAIVCKFESEDYVCHCQFP